MRSWDVLFSLGGSSSRSWFPPMKIPILKGEALLVLCATAATAVMFYLDPPEL